MKDPYKIVLRPVITEKSTWLKEKNREVCFEVDPRANKTEIKKFNLQKSGDLLTELKKWRREASKQQGIPPYMVMHDKTLIDLTIRLPTSTEELKDIKGFGPAKIAKYGDELILILNN